MVEGVLNHFQRWMEHWKVREIFADKNMISAQRRRSLKEFLHLTAEDSANDDVEVVPTVAGSR